MTWQCTGIFMIRSCTTTILPSTHTGEWPPCDIFMRTLCTSFPSLQLVSNANKSEDRRIIWLDALEETQTHGESVKALFRTLMGV